MNRANDEIKTRRKFLKMVSASPLLAGPGFLAGSFSSLLAAGEATDKKFIGWLDSLEQSDGVITSPDQAFDVMDFEPAARKILPPAHFGYLSTGVDDDGTARANREGYSRIQIRARRLVDVENIDMSVNLFGTKWNSPIVLSPVSAQKAFHPEGEVAVARAARAKGHLMMLSTVATSSIEDVTAAAGTPVWQQLYPTNVWEVSRAIVKRAEAAGSPAIVLTVDLQEGSNRETLFRSQLVDKRECSACHQSAYTGFARGRPRAGTGGFAAYAARKPMLNGLDLSNVTAVQPPNMNWDFVKRLRDTVTVKLLIKGIVTREDAQLAVEHGVDGLMVSNHGGRAEETLRPTIESLPEVIEGVSGKIPVIVDGGIRRGTDVFKALAFGASAVGIGRPHAWGLAAFGQPGVEAVLEILRRELRTIMRQAGTISVDKITRNYIVGRSS
ncbi:MAG: alpha-hydroxy-acid oxidizing enzyme [Acidobacteria bacterium 13_2_20CM_57_17]|nr:MAG: alpha-hydroxy-acid oxidizing enzyme [Acidobacteria bacterium 13_2_20CM_57_17]